MSFVGYLIVATLVESAYWAGVFMGRWAERRDRQRERWQRDMDE